MLNDILAGWNAFCHFASYYVILPIIGLWILYIFYSAIFQRGDQ